MNTTSDELNNSAPASMAGMDSDPMGDDLDQDSSAAVAIELLGGATIDQALPEKRKSIPDSVLILALVVAVAGGGLFAMRKMGLGSQIQFTNVEIDYPLDNSAFTGRDDELLADLRNSDLEQVPLSQVQKNPFQLISDGHVIDDQPVAMAGETEAEARLRREQEERRREIVRKYADLDLNSVLLGSTPVARVSGETVRVGDMIEGLFRVTSISARTVNLEVDGKLYTLSLGE